MAQHRPLVTEMCVHWLKPLTAQRSKRISWESESTPIPHRSHTCRQSASLYLFCGKSAQHNGVANTKLQRKDREK